MGAKLVPKSLSSTANPQVLVLKIPNPQSIYSFHLWNTFTDIVSKDKFLRALLSSLPHIWREKFCRQFNNAAIQLPRGYITLHSYHHHHHFHHHNSHHHHSHAFTPWWWWWWWQWWWHYPIWMHKIPYMGFWVHPITIMLIINTAIIIIIMFAKIVNFCVKITYIAKKYSNLKRDIELCPEENCQIHNGPSHWELKQSRTDGTSPVQQSALFCFSGCNL